MDSKDDEESNIERKHSLIENLHYMRSKQESILLSPVGSTSHLPLNDINNTQDHISSQEKAQRKWIENSKSWPVKDELQNAQLQWLREFSSGANFLSTSTPHPKQKHSRYTLPFTPPKSSADVQPRRGVCVYKPGSKCNPGTCEASGCFNEKGNVKIARLEEPPKAPVTKKVQDEPLKKPFSSIPDTHLREERKTPIKRYVTVRKKLERLRNLAVPPEKPEETVQPPDNRNDEKREAARQYILRKRAERERELEIQRRKEIKAEAEKKARMERLRETQQRLIKHAFKRQTPEKRPVSRDSPDSDEECVPLWKESASSMDPQLDTSRKVGEGFSALSPTKTASLRTSSLEEPSITKEEEVKAVDDPHIADLLLDRTIPTQKKMALLDRLEDGALTGKDSLLDIMTCEEYVALVSAARDAPTPHISSVSPKFSNSSSPKPSSRSQTSSNHQYFESNKHDLSSAAENSTCSIIPSTSKESVNVLQYIQKSAQEKNSEFYSSQISPWKGTERSYNLLRAVSNKHAAFEHYNKEYSNPEVISESSRGVINDSHLFKTGDNFNRKSVSEKGIQCHVEENILPLNRPSSSAVMASLSLDSGQIHHTQSERLQKPNVALLPGRTSDPFMYTSSKAFITDETIHTAPLKFGDEGFLDNLIETDIDPPLDPLEREDIPLSGNHFVQDQIVPPNAKGRPEIDLTVVPLKVSRDYNLSSKASDPLSVVDQKFDENRRAVNNSTTVPLNNDSKDRYHGMNSVLNKAINVEKTSRTRFNTDVVDSSMPPVSFIEAKYSNRDSRIEEEIKKLESFNDSITSVLEKKKLVIPESDSNLGDVDFLERTQTSSTIKNNTLPEHDPPLRGSISSSSFDVLSEDVSGGSITKFSLNMFNELLRDEDSRSAQQTSIFKMKEKSLTDRIKAEIAFMEVEKKKLRESGNEEGVRNIRKKIRGLIIKLEHDLGELYRMRKTEKNEYRKRRQKLVEKINAIKTQLKMQSENQKVISVRERGKSSLSVSLDMKKSHDSDLRGSDARAALLEKKRKELEHKESLIAERLAELENISSWKQRLEEGEKRIQELEARLKMTSVQSAPKEREDLSLVERGTSPLRFTSDESQCERQKAEGSYSDTFDQASSSSTHERLDERDTRKMMAIKVPLSPLITLKRRHSSGSDESLIQSQTETQSEASDMEVRVLALQQQLKQRKAKLESLHREYKKSQKERLIAKEQSLLSQIQAYDVYIDQVNKELEKEKDSSSSVKIVKPLIKQPKINSDRRKSDTWLIHDRKNKEVSLDPLSSLPLSGSVDFIPKLLKDKQDGKTSAQKGSNIHFDSPSLERFSLKSKIALKSAHSEPNLLNSPDDRIIQAKVSQSSTESCESDIEKVKYTFNEATEKMGRQEHQVLSQLGGEQYIPNEFIQQNTSSHSSIIEGYIKDDIENEDHITLNSDASTKNGHTSQKGSDGSTQASSTSKIVDLNSGGRLVEDISDKAVSEGTQIEGLPIDEVDVSPKAVSSASSEIETELQFSIRSRSDSVDFIKISSPLKGADDVESIRDNELSSVSEVLNEVLPTSKVNEPSSMSEIINDVASTSNANENDLKPDTLNEISQSEIISEKILAEGTSQSEDADSIVALDVPVTEVSKSETISEALVQSAFSDKSGIESNSPEVIKTRSSSEVKSIFTLMTNNNVASNKDSSYIVSEDISIDASSVKDTSDLINFSRDEKEERLEESVKEVTYLEVSDHVFHEPVERDKTGDGSVQASEISATQLAESKSLAEELQEVFDEDSLKEQEIVRSASDGEDEQQKSTFHSISDVDDIVPSKNDSEDISDGSFPLPVTKDKKKNFLEATSDNKSNFEEKKDLSSTEEEISSNTVLSTSKKSSEKSLINTEPTLKSSSNSVPEEVHTLVNSEDSFTKESLNTPKNDVQEEKSAIDLSYPNESEKNSESFEENKFSESEVMHDSDEKSAGEDPNFEDSLEENSAPLSSLKLKSKLYGCPEEDYESASETSDSEDKMSEEDVFSIRPGELPRQGADEKTTGAPLIDALQREKESALDVVWRNIAESAIEEAKEIVISAFWKRVQFGTFPDLFKSQLERKEVGDNEEEELDEEKLPRDQAAEAEVLRLQQMRIDKEIEELELVEEARQYYYVRAIPDKPPPPYTPRRSSLVASVVEAAGELWAGRKDPPATFMPGSNLREFIWDLASELVLRAAPPSPPQGPPWVSLRRPRPRRLIRTREELLKEVEKEGKIYLGLEERDVREKLIIRWSRKRRDHVDEILVRESGEEEWEWTDFTEEENIVKNRIADALIEESLSAATQALAHAFVRKFD